MDAVGQMTTKATVHPLTYPTIGTDTFLCWLLTRLVYRPETLVPLTRRTMVEESSFRQAPLKDGEEPERGCVS
jgi:hypothetical protein